MPKSSGLGAYHYLGRSDSLDWRTHLFFAIPSALSGFIYDYQRLGGGPVGSWSLLIAVTILIPIVTIELLSQALGKSGWSRPRPIVVGIILLFAGFLRGAVFFFLGGAFGLIPGDDLVFRLIGGPLYVLAIYMVGNYIVLASLDHRRMASTLETERANLKLSKQGFETQLNQLRLAQMSRVRELLAPAIWELEKLLKDASTSKDASRAILALRELNDEIVRPLSHNMIRSFELPVFTRGVSQRSRLGQFVLPAQVRLSRIIPITAFAPFVAVISYSAVSALANPVEALLVSLFVTSVLTLELSIVKRVLGKRVGLLRTAVLLALALGFLLGGTAWLLMSEPVLNLPVEIHLPAFIFFVITMLVFLVLGIVQMQRNQVTEDLEAANEDLRLLNSQLRQRVWLSQKTLATELHGSVQAALNASAMRLAQLKNPKAADLDRVRQDLDTAMQRLGQDDYLSGQSFEELLEELCELWEGSCDIDYQVSEQASAALAADSGAAYCTLEIIREAVNNAIRHGNAKNVQIQVGLKGELLELKVTNDGTQTQLSSPGLGSAIYQELALDYRLKVGSPTILWAKVPLSPAD